MREMLMARFFKKQVLVSNALLHYLLAYLNHVTMTLSAAWEILNPFPQSELAQLSFTNLSCRIVSNISQVHCDFVLYFTVLMFHV